jgi:hypothetical protein
LTERSTVANIGGMRGIIRRLDNYAEARPWLTAACFGVLLASVLTTIEWIVDDSPDWLFPTLLTLPFALVVGFKGQAQRRQRRQG